MKRLGEVMKETAVGSLKEELKPGELVIPDQYFDMTFKREKTFFSLFISCTKSVSPA